MLMPIQVIKDELLRLTEAPFHILRGIEPLMDFNAGLDKLTHKKLGHCVHVWFISDVAHPVG